MRVAFKEFPGATGVLIVLVDDLLDKRFFLVVQWLIDTDRIFNPFEVLQAFTHFGNSPDAVAAGVEQAGIGIDGQHDLVAAESPL